MPNFWSKAGQFITEKISGTHTQDEDFQKACEKMKITEKGLSSLKTVLQNFISYIENFKKYFSDFNASIELIYKDSPFYNFAEEISVKHQIIQSELEEMTKKMGIIVSKTSEWNRIFESAKEQVKIREEKRKIYDHYVGKLSKINKNSKKDQNYIERNEGKFSKAASEYVDTSEKAFNTIKNCLSIAYELANPILDEIITTEKQVFEIMGQSMSCFSNNNERFNEIKNNLDNPNINEDSITYDPIKYMNEKDLMIKISLNRTMSTKLYSSKKRLSKLYGDSTSMSNLERISVRNEDKMIIAMGMGNYNNIFTNSRMTNTFGEMSDKDLNAFYKFPDDFN